MYNPVIFATEVVTWPDQGNRRYFNWLKSFHLVGPQMSSWWNTL